MQTYLPAKLNTNLPVVYAADRYYFLLVLLRQQYLINKNLTSTISEYKCDVGCWKSRHEAAVAREEKLKKENEHLKAMLKLREQQLFANKLPARLQLIDHLELLVAGGIGVGDALLVVGGGGELKGGHSEWLAVNR